MTISELVAAIHQIDNEADLTSVFEAYKTRHKTLGAIRASEIKVGMKVKIINIKPKYLVGLTGVVVEPTAFEPKGNSVTVILDPASTDQYRYTSKRFIPESETEHRLAGIPKQCLEAV